MRQELIVTLVCYFILFIIGAIAMYSLDIAKEMVLGVQSNFFQKHIFTTIIGFLTFLIAVNIPYQVFYRYYKLFYLLGIGLLGMVFAFPKINGVHRWIRIGSFTIQPSEFAKILLVLFLSMYVEQNKDRMESFWNGFLLPMLFSGVYAALIMLQPNLSTAILVLFVSMLALYYGGTKLLYVLSTLVAGVVALMIASAFGYLHSYQIMRLSHFFSGNLAPQVDIALKAVKNSGLTGAGLLGGYMKVYVPEAESDFVLAVIGEDFGFFGILIILITYLFLAYALMRISSFIERLSLRVFTWSYVTLILLHLTINLGVFAGMLPVTGVPLPFISTGGSSMIALLAGFGVIISGVFYKEGRPSYGPAEGDDLGK
ncbi:FtsW/RodA/SpoVE family cell cycle protein [Fervidobacterium thailandense]|uniref:Probable peptidoglycan glycosyltransferase FtsW n=1 Tax=Fervidobacterium thailandense TaxID=1008305 RepID=A0A1E3G5H7_9BACT|nr:FtsW/RodA/SpoVE family cell cycle protein [Fervidobacterium thailandense]ODN31402.1 cell cycle protein [Fervidobacterium thailandense]